MSIYEWVNPEKARFYQIIIKKEDANHIVLHYKWGSCNSNRGGRKKLFVQSYEEAGKYIDKMIKRRKSRGYLLVTPNNN